MVWTSWILAAIYAIMLLQAFVWYKKTTTAKVYISSDRKTSTSAAVVSAQMTATTIPLFLIMPQVVMSEGGLIKGIIISVFVIAGTVAAYLLMAERLRIYSEITGDCRTVPSYISSRFKDSTGWLRAFSASLTTVFMVLLASYTISTAANITSMTFGLSKVSASLLVSVGSVFFLYLGGISASIFADRLRSLVVLGTVIAVFGFILVELIVGNNDHSSVRMIPDMIRSQSISAESICSCIGIALGCFGFPSVIKRFLLIKERKPSKRFCVPTLIWSVICSAGVLLISYMVLSEPSVTAFMQEFLGSLENGQSVVIFNAVIDSLLFVSLLILLMAITDGAILAAAATFSADIFNTSLTHETDEKKRLISNKITVVITGFAAFLLALGEETLSIMEPDFIWATMGACFGPVILFSLYCRRLTSRGAVASMTTGLLVVLIWKFILSSLGGIFSLYELIPGFLLSTVVLYTVSYIDRQKPTPQMLNEFGRMREMVKMQRK